MTVIISQTELDNSNIDTYERAIIYAANLLRSSLLRNNGSQDSRSITIAKETENNNDFLVITCQFDYDTIAAFEQGGNLFKGVGDLSTLDPSGVFNPPTNLTPRTQLNETFIELDPYPGWVATLEEFYLWAVSQSYSSLLSESPPRRRPINYRFFDLRTPNPQVTTEVRIGIRLEDWIQDRHFFNALIPLLNFAPPGSIQPLINNSTPLNNTVPLGN